MKKLFLSLAAIVVTATVVNTVMAGKMMAAVPHTTNRMPNKANHHQLARMCDNSWRTPKAAANPGRTAAASVSRLMVDPLSWPRLDRLRLVVEVRPKIQASGQTCVVLNLRGEPSRNVSRPSPTLAKT